MKKIALITLFCIILVTSTALAEPLYPSTIQIIASGSLDETRTISANEYFVYSVVENQLDKINVNIGVVNGGAIDVLLMDSNQFVNYQSKMSNMGGGITENIVAGGGYNIKSKSYTMTFPTAGTYYIVIDNTNQPQGGADPSGPVDVKIHIATEKAYSTPGFEAIYSILLFTIVFYLVRKY